MQSKSFYAKVYKIVSKIPKGKVATYQTIARLAGSPGAARAVGTARILCWNWYHHKNPNAKSRRRRYRRR